MSLEKQSKTAEDRFREAFTRLKTNKPMVLKSGTPVSQNNVAKEAGCDPSALRKSRFPSLIREIKAFIEINIQDQPSKRQEQLKQRKIRANLTDRIMTVEAQRDFAQSQLICAQRKIVDLTIELKCLKERFLSTAHYSEKNH